MKKTMRKAIALVMTLAMLLSLTVVYASAFGTDGDDNNGSITIQNASNVTYTAYKIFDLSYVDNPDGAVPSVAYYYQGVNVDEDGVCTDDIFTTLSEFFTFTPVADPDQPGVFTAVMKESVAASAIIGALQGLADEGKLPTAAATATGTDGVAEFTDLLYGYYLITSPNTVDGEEGSQSLVTVDSTLPHVTVVDKNLGPTWGPPNTPPNDPHHDPNTPGTPGDGKMIVTEDEEGNPVYVKESSAHFGDTVSFKIALNATAYVQPTTDGDRQPDLVTYYYISDTMEGFSAISNLKVFIGGVGANTEITNDCKLYTDKVNSSTSAVDGAKDAVSFQVTVPMGTQYGSNPEIIVTYDATVGQGVDNVVIGGDGNVNTAKFAYDVDKTFDPNNIDPENPTPGSTGTPYDPSEPNDPDPAEQDTDNPFPAPKDPSDPEVTPDKPFDTGVQTTTYVYSFGVVKFDGATKELLSNAHFSLYECAKPDYVDDSDSYTAMTFSGANGIYEYDKNGTVTDLVSNANGQIIISGLPGGYGTEGTTAGLDGFVKYTFVETKAPAGYNLLTEPQEATINFDNAATSVTKLSADVGGADVAATYTEGAGEDAVTSCVPVFQVNIENNTGTELPSTGGIGTTIFYALGAVLIVGAGILLVTKKRMGANG